MPASLPKVDVAPSLRSLRSDLDASAQQVRRILELGAAVKRTPRAFGSALQGMSAALLFEKPSLRTRVTFELAMKLLGGETVLQTGPVSERESLPDVARNLARWVDVIVARTFEQQTIDDLASWSALPVVNGLSDLYHPCQALADVMTLQEQFGSLPGLKLAYVGDGNNVAHSLLLTCSRLGISCAVATPSGFSPRPDIVARAVEFGRPLGASVTVLHDPYEAVRDADAVYTDVWVSMGQEADTAERLRTFAPFQVNSALMAAAAPHAKFMHCLPAKRGLEVTHEVLESAQSIVFEQAGNRLHAQKAVLLSILGS